MPMTELNKALAEAFGHCRHEMEEEITLKGSIRTCTCGEKYIGDSIAAYRHIKANPPPNYFTLATLKCDKCGGTGVDADVTCAGHGCQSRTRYMKGDYIECLECACLQPCPCQGKPRIISRLQHEIEKRGEWDEFMQWLYLRGDRHFVLAEIHIIVTDLIKLADAYLEWRKV